MGDRYSVDLLAQLVESSADNAMVSGLFSHVSSPPLPSFSLISKGKNRMERRKKVP